MLTLWNNEGVQESKLCISAKKMALLKDRRNYCVGISIASTPSRHFHLIINYRMWSWLVLFPLTIRLDANFYLRILECLFCNNLLKKRYRSITITMTRTYPSKMPVLRQPEESLTWKKTRVPSFLGSGASVNIIRLKSFKEFSTDRNDLECISTSKIWSFILKC